MSNLEKGRLKDQAEYLSIHPFRAPVAEAAVPEIFSICHIHNQSPVNWRTFSGNVTLTYYTRDCRGFHAQMNEWQYAQTHFLRDLKSCQMLVSSMVKMWNKECFFLLLITSIIDLCLQVHHFSIIDFKCLSWVSINNFALWLWRACIHLYSDGLLSSFFQVCLSWLVDS